MPNLLNAIFSQFFAFFFVELGWPQSLVKHGLPTIIVWSMMPSKQSGFPFFRPCSEESVILIFQLRA